MVNNCGYMMLIVNDGLLIKIFIMMVKQRPFEIMVNDAVWIAHRSHSAGTVYSNRSCCTTG